MLEILFCSKTYCFQRRTNRSSICAPLVSACSLMISLVSVKTNLLIDYSKRSIKKQIITLRKTTR